MALGGPEQEIVRQKASPEQLKEDQIIQDEGQVLSHVSRANWQHAPDSTRGARARGHALKTQGEGGS